MRKPFELLNIEDNQDWHQWEILDEANAAIAQDAAANDAERIDFARLMRQANESIERIQTEYDKIKMLLMGCSDGNCPYRKALYGSKGMHTNGGCHCVKEARKHLGL